MYASYLLTYEPDMAVFQTDETPSPNPTGSPFLRVFPETEFVPASPDAHYTAYPTQYWNSTLNAYYRSWDNCTYKGASTGGSGCAVEVEPYPGVTAGIPTCSGGAPAWNNIMTLPGPGRIERRRCEFHRCAAR